MTEALVTPALLTWARQRRDLDLNALAPKLNVKPEAIDAWESGKRRPTFVQAQRLAQVLNVPLGYLFLPDPPAQDLPIPDFRTIGDQPIKAYSPDLLDLVNDLLAKQQWFREFRETEGVEPLRFVGQFTVNSSIDEVAHDIGQVIGVEKERQRATTWEDFLREIVRNADRVGIMVMRSGIVGNDTHRPLDIEEFRGFAISDDLAPLVFINGRDFKGAQIFTLVHELAHIWAGQGGISRPDYSLESYGQEHTVEHFCNRVAAETLVPGQDFTRHWQSLQGNVEEKVNRLARHYRVSSMVILRQAHDYDCISRPTYMSSYRRLVETAKGLGVSAESGGNFHYTLTARNGTAFPEAVIASVAGGTLLHREAARLLDVKVKTLPSIAKHLFGDVITID